MARDTDNNKHQNGLVRIASLSTKHPVSFDLRPDAARLADMATALDIGGVRKLHFTGEIAVEGKTDWRLTGHLGATVVQPCVVTLEPVTSRVEDDITRLFVADWSEPEDAEVEMQVDETHEPLGTQIDLFFVAQEALALALPPYPRAQGARLGQVVAAQDGVTPMSDDDAKPFASLAAFRDKLGPKR